MRNRLSVLLLAALLASCSETIKQKEFELVKTSFEDLGSVADDDMLGAYNAYIKSCDKIAAKHGEFLNADSLVKINREAYLLNCQKAKQIMPAKFKEFVLANFTPYRVLYHGSDNGRFTSYYEAEIHASRTRDDIYKYPVYGRPYDLVEVNLKDFDSSLPAKAIVGRVEDGRLKPYPSRADITAHGINAPVVIWGDSDIDIYIMQIQGSAVAILPDGERLRIAYAANNGRPFKGIGSILLSKGLLSPSQASMGSIKQWLKDNSGLAKANMEENQRYIFHKLGNPEGPVGALGVPLTAGRSLAVDTSYMPLGALLWLETSLSDGSPLNRLVVAQDIGGAIKGAVRGDYFYGSGGDDILEAAGKMNSTGRYFVLIPNSQEVSRND
ncbi:MAG: MltA domain-containing protein [Alphaproteobacteria bacterium]|nr:MltA domain-containing protein [Alphaproteobacteria bacterium]